MTMKNIKRNYIPIVVAAIILTSCGGLKKMQDKANTVSFNVTPNPLEMHGGEVKVAIKGKFPEKYFNKNAVLTLTPTLKYATGETELDPLVLQGENVKANNQVIKYTGGDFNYSSKVAYNDAMRRSDLVIKMKAQIKDKTPIDIAAPKVADGIITTPLLVKIDPKVIYYSDKYVRTTSQSVAAKIYFDIMKYNIKPTELKKDEIKNLESTLKNLSNEERKQLREALILAYASPDGDINKINTPLSKNRGTAAQDYFVKALKQAKLTQQQQKDLLKVTSTPEDWEGFKQLLETSDIRDKELILRVLSMYSDPEVREKEIRNIAAAFQEIAEKILPKLRRSEIKLNIDVIGYSDEELISLAQSKPENLGLEELLRAASLINDVDTKLAIYQKAFDKYPNDSRAINNIGCIYMSQRKFAEAQNAFEKARSLNDDNVVKNNLGAALLAQKQFDKAEELLTAAMGAGDEVNYNLGIIKIVKGDYKTAVTYFGGKPSFNTALAQLLNGEGDKALATLNQLGEVDDAHVYYLKAIISARQGKEEGVMNNLRTAIAKNSALKNYAKDDVEFIKYFNNEAFSAIVK